MIQSHVAGYVTVALLNVLAVLASLAVTMRARLAGRYEQAVAAAMIWNGLVVAPVYGLGLLDQLYRGRLAVVAALLFALVLVACKGRDRWPRFAREVLGVGRAILEIPFVGIRGALRSRSPGMLAVFFAALIIPWSAYTAWLSASWRGWDALWYHEPIIGFTIQNHGLAMTALPPGNAQKINGYPRLAELTDVWFVIFTDRRLIDLANHVMAPTLVLSIYVLARRYCANAIACAAMGCAVLAMPHSINLLGSTYVDLHNAVFLIAAAHFCTRAPSRLRDACLGALCIAMAVASKWMALPGAGILTLIAIGRVLNAHHRARPLATYATLAGCAALILGLASVTYVRNYLHFHNPFWPEFKYDNEKLGIHWPGLMAFDSENYAQGVNRLDMNLPLGTFVQYLFRAPYSGPNDVYAQINDYGVVNAWAMIPMVSIAFVVLLVFLLRGARSSLLDDARARLDTETIGAGYLALTLVACVYTAPGLWAPRYQLAALGLGAGIVGWLFGRPQAARLADSVGGLLGVLVVATFVWTQPRWWLWPHEASALAAIRYPEREVTPVSALVPAFTAASLSTWSPASSLDMRSGSAIPRDVGLARDRELRAGDEIAFDDSYATYLGLLWNEEFSNRVVWIPTTPTFLEELRASPAKWVYASFADPLYAQISAPKSGFQLVGTYNLEGWGSLFRRAR